MTKRLNLHEFVNNKPTEKHLLRIIEDVLVSFSMLEEAIIGRTINPSGDNFVATKTNDAVAVIKHLANSLNANNVEEAQNAVIKLQRLWQELVPFKSAQEISTIIKTNLQDAGKLLKQRMAGVSAEPFVPLLPGVPRQQVVTDKDKLFAQSANVGSGILGANKITPLDPDIPTSE
jgi:hypothetical protein